MSTDEAIQEAWLAIPLGYLHLRANAWGIQEANLCDSRPIATITRPSKDIIFEHLQQAITQFDAYFLGQQKAFHFTMQAEGTPFQLKVWEMLTTIPYGETISYVQLARKLGDKNLTRAVGAANARNPIAIAIPCHRVIGNNGALTGYASGLWRKEQLLKHEAQYSGKPIQLSLFK